MIRSRIAVFIAVGIALAGLLAIGLFSAQAVPPLNTPLPGKATIEARVEATDAAGRATARYYMAMGTVGPKHPELKASTSCPRATPIVGMWPQPIEHSPPFKEMHTINYAMALASTGAYYLIWAGEPNYIWETGGTPVPDSLRQGLLIVEQYDLDPCASMAAGISHDSVDYKAPRGPLTLTSVDGDTVIFSIAGGGTGRFNYVLGEFVQ